MSLYFHQNTSCLLFTAMLECKSGSINNYCYVCGKYTVPQLQNSLSEKIEHYYCFYFSKVVLRRTWSPNICCRKCYAGLSDWSTGKVKSMPFGVPMQWLNPGPLHDQYNCYVCANDARGQNRHRLKKFCYQSVQSATLPKPHSEDVPVPKRPSPEDANQNTDTANYVDLPFAPSISLPLSEMNPSIFSEKDALQPLNEQQLHSLARNLHLSKRRSILLGIELRKHKFIQSTINVSAFRTRNEVFKQYFSVNAQNDFVYCKDVIGLTNAMNIADYKAEEWRLFIDSSQSSLKGVYSIF